MSCRTVLAAALVAASAAYADEVDGIAARVGSSVILKSDVLTEMRRVGASSDRYDEIREEMVERELILRAAIESKLQMQEWVVENRLREIVDRAFGGDRNNTGDEAPGARAPGWRGHRRGGPMETELPGQCL